MIEIPKSANEREALGWQAGLVGLGIAFLGSRSHASWLVAVGLVAAVIGGIIWGTGMLGRD